jgi:sugar phosphate isomerase/epimerase
MDRLPKYSILEYPAVSLSFDDEIAQFREGGAAGVGITEFLGPRRSDPKDMLRILSKSGMQPTVCWPCVPSFLPLTLFGGPQDPGERTFQMCAGITRLSVLKPIAFGCVTGAQGSYSRDEARKHVIHGLREAARAAAKAETAIAIEPIHPSIADDFSIVTTLQQTVDLIEEAGCSNVGISFDIWHSWDQPDLLGELQRHVNRFLIVHICDWRQPTRSWCDRVLPGEGGANVPSILGALESAGYDGWYELEVLSDNGIYGNAFPDSLWNANPSDLVRRGKEAFFRSWKIRTRAA